MEIVMPARPRPEVDGVTVDRDVFIPMRDGVSIAVDIYRPTELNDGKYPTLYAMSAYQKDLVGMPALPIFPWRECGPIEWYVKRGYVYVLADARGTGKSEGVWRLHDRAEQEDMYDTIEWIAAQAWSNGKVGMIGWNADELDVQDTSKPGSWARGQEIVGETPGGSYSCDA